MKRSILAMAGSLLLAGCAATTPTSTTPPSPSSANYFEYNRDDRTYVFGSVAAMQRFIKDGYIADPQVLYFKSEAITIESPDRMTYTRLAADCEKQHK